MSVVARGSLLVVRGSLLVVRGSLLVVRGSILALELCWSCGRMRSAGATLRRGCAAGDRDSSSCTAICAATHVNVCKARKWESLCGQWTDRTDPPGTLSVPARYARLLLAPRGAVARERAMERASSHTGELLSRLRAVVAGNAGAAPWARSGSQSRTRGPDAMQSSRRRWQRSSTEAAT
jgi:hypothetical protein